ncbi:MAG: helix-turn-helix domain-containing protein, partial [Deinococcus sp.]
MTGRPGPGRPGSRQPGPQPTGRSPLGFGEGLRRAREERGLSLQEVAGQTRLRLDLLRALEAEDLSRLPERTLARSFLQNYARALGLDPAPLLQEFDRRLPLPQQMRPMQPRTARGRNRRPPSSSGLLGGVLGGVLLLGVAGYFGYSAYQAQGGTRTRATDPVALPSTRQVRLSLNSVPSGARVYLDNRYLGLTPVQDFPLDARPQASLRVEYPGLPTYQAPVDLNADRHLTLTLKPLPVQPLGSGVPAATSSGPASLG